jgi:ABC-type multidrug transport system fused ATPase/permease subunit
LLLDDPISALDHNTADSIVRDCFAGPLMKDRIVVLATHRTDLVHHVATQYVNITQGHAKVTPNDPFSSEKPTPDDEHPSNSQPNELIVDKILDANPSPSKFIEDEHREKGGVKGKVWLTFMKAAKNSWIMLGIMMGVTQVFRIIQGWFWKSWGEAYGEHTAVHILLSQAANGLNEQIIRFQSSSGFQALSIFEPGDYLPPPKENVRPWLVVLLIISILTSLSLLAYACSQLVAVYSTSKNLFAQVMKRITHANFRFYDVTPAGRLMNRLTSDIAVLDGALTYFGHTIFYAMLWASSVIVIASISPLFLILVVLLMAAFVSVFNHFLPTSRSLKRLETVSLSPLFTRIGELLQSQGLTTVRAFRAQQEFEDSTISIIDQVQAQAHFYWSVQNWLSYRYENISAASTFGLTVVALLTDLSAGLTAFMLINASTLIGATHTLCLRFGDLQTEFVSVERVVELIDVEQEPPGTNLPPAYWPRFGANIAFENVTVRYAPHLEPSLIDISLNIPGGSITAVIGRTGSGKSTLASALLNIVRAEKGVIIIDDERLTDIDVNTLRRRVTFIPQEPVLFDGTIHDNLDPVSEHTVTECATVLARVTASAGQQWSLDDRVESGGRNFSQGQRQLLGITRAVLRRSSIIILDEATASIDVETSMALHKIIREEMHEATVITIAHRVEAVKGADYFIELEAGRVKRQGKVEEIA